MDNKLVTYEDVKKNPAVQTYIKMADRSLEAIGYTEHSFAHVENVSSVAEYILSKHGNSEREIELAKIAAYLHDIGNLINREDHSQSGAIMAFRILGDMGMQAEELAIVMTAIGNHDEGNGVPVSEIAAAVIIADKCDVRRSRVRNRNKSTFDIHDRVNYAVKNANLSVSNEDTPTIALNLTLDDDYSSVMDYFEIFLDRMILVKKAAASLGYMFKLQINGQRVV